MKTPNEIREEIENLISPDTDQQWQPHSELRGLLDLFEDAIRQDHYERVRPEDMNENEVSYDFFDALEGALPDEETDLKQVIAEKRGYNVATAEVDRLHQQVMNDNDHRERTNK